MGYTHDREENDAHELEAQLLVKFDAEGNPQHLDPDLYQLLCDGPIPEQLRIPADLLPFEDFNPEKLKQLGVVLEPVKTLRGTVMAAIIKEPILTAMRNVAATMREELEKAQSQPASFQDTATPPRKIVPFSELAKRIKEQEKNPKAKKER